MLIVRILFMMIDSLIPLRSKNIRIKIITVAKGFIEIKSLWISVDTR